MPPQGHRLTAPPVPEGPLRITLLVRRLERTGGAEQQLAKLALGLHRSGQVVRVLTFYAGDSLEHELRGAGVRVDVLGKLGRWDVIGFLRRLRREVRRESPDILQSYLVPPNVLAALLTFPANRTRVVWGVRASNMDLAQYDWSHRALERVETVLARRPALVIANSHLGRDLLVRRGFLRGRVEVVPNGIDVDRFAPGTEDAAALRAEWLGGAAGPLIGLVARLDPMKDHSNFLAAAAILLRQLPGARFVCVGSIATPHAAAVLAQCQGMGLGPYVRWAEQRADIPRVMSACDVVTLSSAFGEGFPNVLGEAMACGVPVVSTDVGDAAHIVGSAGSIVPVRDPAAMARAWNDLHAMPPDRKQNLRVAARQRIVEHFSVARMVEQTLMLYRRTCGQPAAP